MLSLFFKEERVAVTGVSVEKRASLYLEGAKDNQDGWNNIGKDEIRKAELLAGEVACGAIF